jgi:hypothetical protein
MWAAAAVRRCSLVAVLARTAAVDHEAEQNKREPIVTQMAKASASFSSKLMTAAMMAFAVAALAPLSATAESPSANGGLRNPADFRSIPDTAERARAIFIEIGKLLTHPRCMNCHPAADRPLQGADHHEHMPPVWRGEHGHLATNCSGCHTEHNFTLTEAASYKSIPGHPRWDVAPSSMAWENKSLGEICRQLKDIDRNGGRDLTMLQQHIATDDLVAWAWNPGEGREPAPGSQELAGQLVQAWIDSGAECPR